MADDLSLVAMTAAAQGLLNEVADRPARVVELPLAITAVAARLKQLERDQSYSLPVIQLNAPRLRKERF